MLPLLWIVFTVICILAFLMAFYAFTENYDQWVPASIAIIAVACAVVLGINNVQRHSWETELQKLQIESIKAQAIKEWKEQNDVENR